MGAVLHLRLDSGITLSGEPAALQVGASVWLPAQPAQAKTLLLCLPGGNMNRRYYDLRPPIEGGAGAGEVDESFSFAAQMTARGFVVAALDHLGLGDSSKPEDGWQLTTERLVAANTRATAALLSKLREGRLADGVPALPALRSIGVGHSMGAMLTILQQHAARQHAAVVLLGFSTRGLPEYAPPQVKDATDPVAVRPMLVELARSMFGKPYPVIHSSNGSGNNAELFGSRKADPRGVAALKAATDCMLPVPALMSMVPGNVAPEAATLDVPLFIGLGGRDMVGPTHAVPAAFPKCGDLTLIVLPETGHSHFLFPTRGTLFERLATWAHSV